MSDERGSPPWGFTGTVHRLKTRPDFFETIMSGRKKFEVPRDDRCLHCGDQLLLQEYVLGRGIDPGSGSGRYTGRQTWAIVNYILKKRDGLAEGYVALGIVRL